MRTELCWATAVVGILLAVSPKSASAEALPVLNKALDVRLSDVGFRTRGHGYYEYGVPHYSYGLSYYDYYGEALPYIDNGPNGGRCDWYYRNAIDTGSSYWSDRYDEKCTGY
jgi:hypothetical protein